MGTSSLYKGPKKTSLLPSDYTPDENTDKLTSTEEEQNSGASNEDDSKEEAKLDNQSSKKSQESEHSNQPSENWGKARRSMRKAMNDRSVSNIKSAIRNYTRALGGHTNATRQASKVRVTVGTLYSYFSGSPDAIRQRLISVGIQFDGRVTKDIFNDICGLIAPIPNDIEDSLTNKAIRETFAEIAADQTIDLNLLDSFNEELLQRLVGGLVKHYIFDKLLLQSEQTALKNSEKVSDLRELERSIKTYIDGIVDSVIPHIVKSGLNPEDFNKAVETLFDISYQQMEELQ
ncbi:hypothetical protein [uncultured Muribaculum sp.]|uniref:hypothetical protein n=1 Tax=uncultured Muribaculum sp. TaxID=1918613 RepID=UPI0025B7641B|nr:hypothetical protein [uncultured Muribaculum sp.]